jgi:hypothetical protein
MQKSASTCAAGGFTSETGLASEWAGGSNFLQPAQKSGPGDTIESRHVWYLSKKLVRIANPTLVLLPLR